jgi:hypothetical protein
VTALADIIPAPGGPSFKSAKVLTVSGHTLTVDIGGSVQAFAGDGCNPRPDDTVLLLVDGATLTAVAVLSGPYRQATITVTSSTSTSVSGVINGVVVNIPKVGAFTVAVGQVCPLLWSADGARVWALANEQSASSAPADGGAGGSNPGGVTQGAQTYAATSSGQYRMATGDWAGGAPTTSPTIKGAFFYGPNRFRELQGRTIRYCRAYLPGSGAPTVWGHPHASRPAGAPTLAYNAGARALGGWVSLPVGLASYLVSGSGTGGLAFSVVSGLAQIRGLPYGQIEIGWRI